MAIVVLTAAAREQAGMLPNPIRNRVLRLLERLRHWPAVSGARALRGNLSGKYRLRTGDYRLQFSVQTRIIEAQGKKAKEYRVLVEKIGHRDGFYEE